MQKMILKSQIIYVLLAVICVSADNKGVYEKLVQISQEKCPYLLGTSLIKPKPEFFRFCPDYEGARQEKPTNIYNAPESLCIVYFDSFANLCNAANTTLDVVKRMVVEPAIKIANKSLLADICPAFQNHSLLRNGNCAKYCADVDKTALPVCSLSLFMTKIAAQTSIPNVQPKEVESKNDTAPGVIRNENGSNSSTLDLKAKGETKTVHIVEVVKTSQDSVTQDATIPDGKQTPLKNSVEAQTFKENTNNIVTTNTKGNINSLSSKMVDEDGGLDVALPSSTEKIVNIDNKEGGKNDPVIGEPDEPEPLQTKVLAKSSSSWQKVADMQQEVITQNESPQTNNNNNNRIVASEDQDEEDFPSRKMEEPLMSSKLSVNNMQLPFRSSDFDQTVNDPQESFFFSYFMMGCIVFILGYVGFHNKQKIMAIIFEGRRGRRQQRRRPNSASYHKLDSNLEEAMASTCNKTTSNIIY